MRVRTASGLGWEEEKNGDEDNKGQISVVYKQYYSGVLAHILAHNGGTPW